MVTPSNHSTNSAGLAPPSRFSKSVEMGRREPRNTHAPLMRPSLDSTAEHLDQLIILKVYQRNDACVNDLFIHNSQYFFLKSLFKQSKIYGLRSLKMNDQRGFDFIKVEVTCMGNRGTAAKRQIHRVAKNHLQRAMLPIAHFGRSS
jgi:hypothetical protein